MIFVNDSNYRSVIIDPETKDILCFAPPKSVKLEYLKNASIIR